MPAATTTAPKTEKLVITWDDLNTRNVEQKLRQNDAMQRNRDYARVTDVPDSVKTPARTSIWYHTAVYMTFFGLLGGLLAWTCGAVLHFKPSSRVEAAELISTVQDINRAAAIGKLTAPEVTLALTEVARAGRDNPYFAVFSNPKLTAAEKEKRIETIAKRDRWKAFIGNVLAYGIAGLLIAICLSVAEPLVDRNMSAAVINGSTGAALGLFGGILVALFVDSLYHALGGTDGEMTSGRQIFARATTWGVLGLTLSLAPGVVMRNRKKLAIGALGGLLGGVIGGALFDPVAFLTENQHVSKLIGLCAIGLVAGLGSGLIENAAKSGWLRVVQGLIAGKQFILYRNPTYIGSSPDNQIYLFKDAQVGRRHAAIHVDGGKFEIEDLPLGGPTYVNSQPIARVRLRNGDRIQIGTTAFLFQEKQRTV